MGSIVPSRTQDLALDLNNKNHGKRKNPTSEGFHPDANPYPSLQGDCPTLLWHSFIINPVREGLDSKYWSISGIGYAFK
jgi:hypothetical protein